MVLDLSSLGHQPYQCFRFTPRGPEGLLSKSLYVSLQGGRKPGSTQVWRNDVKQDPEQVKKNLDMTDACQ